MWNFNLKMVRNQNIRKKTEIQKFESQPENAQKLKKNQKINLEIPSNSKIRKSTWKCQEIQKLENQPENGQISKNQKINLKMVRIPKISINLKMVINQI